MPEAIREIAGIDPQTLGDDILTSSQPLVLRGLVANWPMVQAALQSSRAASAYLRGLYRDATVGAFLGMPEIRGRFFYNDDISGFNFRPVKSKLDTILDEIARHEHAAHPPAIYVGSTTIDTCLPDFRKANDVNLGGRNALASIWIGNQTRIAAHHDLPDNLACVAAGQRRFTLFAPEEIGNLYVGPVDFTPAGQAISLVDFHNPDLGRFPRFTTALEHAQVATLGPGDAIFIPSLWWHHVEGLDPFNVLVNYWWRQSPAWMDTPMHALTLAMMTVRDLPPAQREAMKALFDHYVFDAGAAATHIPANARRSMAPMTEEMMRELRARLLQRLNR